MNSVYVLGAAGAGKSTWVDALFADAEWGHLEDLAAEPNAKNIVTLRGHPVYAPWGDWGMYLGVRRDSFPGTDGLDRASSPVGEKWLRSGPTTGFVIGEGATLATRRFLGALDEVTDLLLVHLYVDPEIGRQRFAERGSDQDPSFVKATATRSANRAAEIRQAGRAVVLNVDTADPDAWDLSLDLAQHHLAK